MASSSSTATVRAAARPRRARLRADAPSLTRDDWLVAAHDAVVEGGFDALRVLSIARALRVTRGSFYWHFASHAAWQDALLQRWRERQATLLQALQAPLDDDPVRDLERVLDAALDQAGSRMEHMRFELALRGLGRRDPAVARLLAEVDAQRMALFQYKFQRLTGDAARAGELAALFYLAMVGSYQALARPTNPPQMKALLSGLITRYLVAPHRSPGPPLR